MYGWPKDIDVSIVFVGREIDVILFTKNSITLYFDFDISVIITTDCTYTTSKTTERISFPVRETSLISLIGYKIFKAELLQNKDLLLTFFDCSQLLINGNVKEFKCYSVNIFGKVFEV